MVHFITLLVGLVTGPQAVEVAVSGPVARVELLLDGHIVAAREGEPWILRCNLGRRPRPAELVAVAFDSDGRELGRDRQWLNLPGRDAAAAIVPELDADGRVVSARITWTAHGRGEPRRVRIEIDGERVRVDFPYRIDLSGYDSARPHVLSAEIRFDRDLVMRRELAFGRGFSGVFAAGLTAVPVRLAEIDALPARESMADWFAIDGRPAAVAAVEEGAADLVIVRHPGAGARLEELVEAVREPGRSRRRRSADSVDTLGDDVEVRVMLAEPVLVDDSGGRPTLLFPVSDEVAAGGEGLLKPSLAASSGAMMSTTMRLANAVALAGMRAAENDRRRAVLVLLGDARGDESFLEPAAVAAYLADLGVPLVVWDLAEDADALQPGWAPDLRVENAGDLRRATRKLRRLLEDQRIVWIAGEHLPHRVKLTGRAIGVRLVR